MKSRCILAIVSIVCSSLIAGCDRAVTNTASTAISPSCEVALAPAGARDENVREIVDLKQRLRESPRDGRALERLGYRYVARARVTNDPGDYTLAEKTAECMASINGDDPAALLLRGHALHQMHRFAEAEQIARRLTAQREFVLDYGLLGDSLMDQGRLTDAAVAYQKMIDLKPFYQSYTRAAHIRWLKGDLAGAHQMIEQAIKAASRRDPESIAWAYTRLATYELQRGRLSHASAAVDAALQYQPEYAAALLARGRVLLAMKRPAESIEPLRRAATLNPLPEYEWALADALRLLKRDREAAEVEAALETRGAASDPRTLALFLATRGSDLERAITLAHAESQVRGDVFTLDAVAWTLAAAGRTGEARDVMTRALAEGTADARLFLHAAAIHAEADRPAEARRWLQKVEDVRSTLLPSELDALASVRSRVAGSAN